MIVNVAIDGPAGAGKSTVARTAASKLGFIYVDTGALYRCVAYYSVKNNIGEKSRLVSELAKMEIRLCHDDKGVQHVYLNGEDVSGLIRTPEVSMIASKVSAIPDVRQFLFELQKSIARENSVIMDGRDIGTVVLPDAEVKIYLTASVEARAKRRWLELQEKGEEVSLESIKKDIEKRDYDDMHRDIAPLTQAKDAVLIDTSEMSLEESVAAVLETINEKVRATDD